MRTRGGFVAHCDDCNMTQVFPTQLQRQRWIVKAHVAHTLWLWRANTEERKR